MDLPTVGDGLLQQSTSVNELFFKSSGEFCQEFQIFHILREILSNFVKYNYIELF